MDLKKLALVPAALALGLYGYSMQGSTASTTAAAQVETDTGADGGDGHSKNDDGGDGHAKNDDNDNDDNSGDNDGDGGDGHDKNGGDNGGGEHPKNGGEDPSPPPPPPPPPPPKPEKPGRNVEVTIVGGGDSFYCRVGNRSIRVGTVRQCNRLRLAADGDEEVVVVRKTRKARRVVVSGGGEVVVTRKARRTVVVEGGGYGYGYGYGEGRVVRYYGSKAAVMQAERRARKGGGSVSYGGAVTGYNYGNGVAVTGNGNSVVVNGNVYVNNAGASVSNRVLRKKKRRVVLQDYGYDGVNVHYGPAVTKSGGY